MSDDFSYVFGALNSGTLYIAGVANELDEQNVHHTIIWERPAQDWERYFIENGTQGVAAFDVHGVRTVVYMGLDGLLRTRGDNGTSVEEVVDSGDDAPSLRRTLTTIRVIGEHLYVGGMRRMVYRRPLTGQNWERYDDGLRLASKDSTVAGINSLDGLGPEEIYAVGFGGEIWLRYPSSWVQIDSPTNCRLAAVRCSPDGTCFVGGANGVLLTGRADQWSVIEHEFMSETFYCIEKAFGHWFLCADSGKVFELVGGPRYEVRPFEVPSIDIVSWIAADTNTALFVGATGVMSFDGQSWTDVTPTN